MSQPEESLPAFPDSAMLSSLLEAAFHLDPDRIVLLDNQGRVLFSNAAAQISMDQTHPEEMARLRQIVAENRASVLETGKAEYGAFLAEIEGGNREFEFTLLPLRSDGGQIETLLFRARDVTVEQQALEDLRECNRHLREAMQETHHRVKNNLQVIAALVEMQTPDAPDAHTTHALQRINQHVQALAVIHDILTQEAKADEVAQRISSREMLEKLLPLLQTILPERSIRYDIADVILHAREASALALICNELVSNAAKHGAGEVNLLFRKENGTAVLEVSDNGSGFPTNFSPDKSANTGLELVRNLASWDLGGNIRFFNCATGGACVTLQFPLPA